MRVTGSSQHTQGPLDGSLYATILKSPKSPERTTPAPFPTTADQTDSSHLTPNKPQRTAAQNLISPPPEFSNTKLEVSERYSATPSPYPVNSNRSSPAPSSTNSTYSKTLNHRATYSTAPNASYEEIRVPSRSSSRETNLRHLFSHQSTPRPSSAQSQYQDQQRSSSVSRSSNYTPIPSHQLRSIDSAYHYSTINENERTPDGAVNTYPDGRESVRSPLTLSMDSGISSSGIVNSEYKLYFNKKLVILSWFVLQLFIFCQKKPNNDELFTFIYFVCFRTCTRIKCVTVKFSQSS